MDKGWFKVPGIRPNGDRTLDEQRMGLEHALTEAHGKTVLDLGCAEGLISKEFAVAGAASVLGIELLESHLAIARKVCRTHSQVSFKRTHLADFIARYPTPGPEYDIVLALGIIHKLDDPAVPLRFAASVCNDLLLYRASATAKDGVIRAKHTGVACNVPELMEEEGFKEERLIPGVRGEAVQYWRRKYPS